MKALRRRPLAVFLSITALLIAGSAALLAAAHAGQQSPGRTSTSAATATGAGAGTAPGSGATATATARHPTATPPQGNSGEVGLAPTAAPGAGRIISATLTVDHTSYNGVCSDAGAPFVFTLTVNVTPHITSVVAVDYEWLGDTGGGIQSSYILLAGEETTKVVKVAVSTFGRASNGTDSWLAIHVDYPTSLTTNQAHFSVNCIPSLASVVGSASPATWAGTCASNQDFSIVFSADLAPVGSGVDLSLSLPWTMSTDIPNDSTSTWYYYTPSGNAPILVHSNGQAIYGVGTIYFLLHLTSKDANGSYWITVTVIGPNNSSITKTVTITKNCS